ncbi:hypothetical protein [Bacillus sp. SG-1]|uniref:hypothetical protein n=1 Tax=Bacillus sp. SG-1 TaxID=161544 RepID=UPI00015430FA|nr:hypothetical protein [Bacillus sp. SG-1]EDL66652.1 hypothetical protein BSG1_04830 [Bacillus sp. SG-1]
MKKYVIFIISFILMYVIVQVLAGWVLTALYAPTFPASTSGLPQEVEFGQVTTIGFLLSLIVATLAFYFTQKFTRTSK